MGSHTQISEWSFSLGRGKKSLLWGHKGKLPPWRQSSSRMQGGITARLWQWWMWVRATHSYTRIQTQRASGCRWFGPPLQQWLPAEQVCVCVWEEAKLACWPHHPDRAVLTSRMSFLFRRRRLYMLDHDSGALWEIQLVLFKSQMNWFPLPR